MCDESEAWKELKKHRKQAKLRRRRRADEEYFDASQLADDYGMDLVQCSDTHYQLIGLTDWILNIYPGTQRLYNDPNHGKPPYLLTLMPDTWGLEDVVRAVIKAEGIEVVDG